MKKNMSNKITKTFKEIQEVDGLVGMIYKNNPDAEKGKFGYAWKRFIDKNCVSLIKELNEKLLDNKIENALIDSNTKALLYEDDKSTLKFSKEGMKLLLEANRKLEKEYNEKKIEIIPFIVKEKDLPKMSEEAKEALTGLVI